jgi:hypothetical protein
VRLQAATPLDQLTEKEWSAQVVELATLLGWKRYHTYRSTRSAAGWPDEALVRDRLVLLELKTEAGRVSPAQSEWLRALVDAGVEVYVARPTDLDDLAQILTHRGDPFEDPLRAAARLGTKTRAEIPLAVHIRKGGTSGSTSTDSAAAQL